MGLDELVARLDRVTDARVAEIRARATAEKGELDAASAARSASRREEALATRAAARRMKLDQELALARQRAHTERLAAEYALLERVFARTRELIAVHDRDTAYLAAVPRQLERALRFVEGQAIVVHCRPALAAAVRAALGTRAEASIEEDVAAPVGVRIALRDGSMDVDDTLLGRLSRLRPRLAMELVGEALP